MILKYLEVAGLLCLAVVQPVFAQYNRATSVEIQNGKPTAWWSESAQAPSTSIEVISPLPTIFYNCYYAGSLCNNVELTQNGAQAGTIDMELVFDKDQERKETRRTKNCPSSWNRRHTCPEANQPDVWVRDAWRNADRNKLRPNKISSSLQYGPGNKGKINYLIADYYNFVTRSLWPSGLMYTCDEFPFASTIQGGTGPDGDPNGGLTYSATTYCAPQGSRCGQDVRWQNSWLAAKQLLSQWQALNLAPRAKNNWIKAKGINYPTSDQNMQAHALSELSKHFAKLDGDLFLFKLKTINDPNELRFAYMDTGDPEDEEEDDDDDGGGNSANAKRDLGMHPEQQTNTTSSMSRHSRGLDFGLGFGLGAGALSVGASLALEYHSHSPMSAEVVSSDGYSGLGMSKTKEFSGFISITRSATNTSIVTGNSTRPTGASIITGGSIEPEPTADNGTYRVPPSHSQSGLVTVATLSQSNRSIVSDLTSTLHPTTSSNVSSQLISPNSSTSLAIHSTWSAVSNRSMPLSAAPSVSSDGFPTLNSSGLETMITGISNQTTGPTQKPVLGNFTAPLTSGTTIVETSAPFPANQSVGLQRSSASLLMSNETTSTALPASRSSLSSVVVPTLANATSSTRSTVAISANSTSPARELNLLKRRSKCLCHFDEPDRSGAHVVYFSSSVIATLWDQYNHKLLTCSPPCIIVLPPFKLTEETTITPDPTTTKDRTITFPPITTDMVSFSQVTIQKPGDKIIPVPVIDLPKPITLTDEKPPATITPKVTVRLPVLPPIALETPPPTPQPSSTPVPPPPPPASDDDETEEEEEEEEQEEQDDENCDVPGWDPSDFPMPVPDGENPDAETPIFVPDDTTLVSPSSTVAPSPEPSVPSSSSSQSEPASTTSDLPPPPPSSTTEPPPPPPPSTSEPPPPPPSSTSEPPP
ncbi:hypothetical protein KCU67_g5446, partial [Aureobasidium melanogenum]